MRAVAIVALACCACIGKSRRPQPEAEDISCRDLANFLLALNAPVTKPLAQARLSGASVHDRARRIAMTEEPSDTAVIVGAAAAAGLLGAFLEQGLVTDVLLAVAAAYASTLNNGVGDATKKVGKFAAKTYNKAKEINEEYDILAKGKSVTDSVLTVADNINKNYGISEKIDEKLLISDKVGKAKDKVTDVLSKITDKVDELKSAATK
mmetsp:Transcript_17199/g.27877  ORF Transcript_17199/g.27877 Transcript_17199/m.27877 type:complete len:208 (+) Transcript_17199:67-690(+)